MDGVARVRFEDAIIVMPFDRQYEKARAFESAEFYAQRYGEICLELDHCEIRVRGQRRRGAPPCSRCKKPTLVTFVCGEASLCPRCVREPTTTARHDGEAGKNRRRDRRAGRESRDPRGQGTLPWMYNRRTAEPRPDVPLAADEAMIETPYPAANSSTAALTHAVSPHTAP